MVVFSRMIARLAHPSEAYALNLRAPSAKHLSHALLTPWLAAHSLRKIGSPKPSGGNVTDQSVKRN